jgi:hypothetical protein
LALFENTVYKGKSYYMQLSIIQGNGEGEAMNTPKLWFKKQSKHGTKWI